MAHSVPYPSTDPLLGKTSKPINETHSPPLSSTTRTIIKVLSVVRIATGTACLIAPRFTCALFMYPIAAEYGFLVRMVGARDIVFGELLMTAEDKGREDGGRHEIKRAIWAGIVADVVDIGSLVFGVAMGQVGNATGGLLGVAAVGALGLGAFGLRVL